MVLPLMTVLALVVGGWIGVDAAMADNAECFQCHGTQSTAPTQTIAGKTVLLWVDPIAYAAGKHRAQDCTTCHGPFEEAHDKSKRTYGGWARFSRSASTSTTDTWNFWKVSGDKCIACHASAAGFASSDHATSWNMAHTPDGAARRVERILGSDGTTYTVDEDYTEANCGRCHMGNNCAPCHWKTPIINNPKETPTGGITSILDLWTSYSATATTVKSALCENAIDWTQNIATHDFRTKTDLTSSNTVCIACHGGYKNKPDDSYPAIGVYGVGMSRHGQSEEMQRSGARGVHETLQLCTDCHKTIHHVTSPESMLQWRQNPDVTCVSCHPTRKIAGVGVPHQNVTCLACHADGVDAILDPDGGGQGVALIIPRVVKHLVVQGWASHDLRRDVDCSRCHVNGGNQTGAPAMSKITTTFNPHPPVKKLAMLTTPAAPSSVLHRRSFTVLGYVSQHTSGTAPVALRFYRYRVGRGYVYYKTLSPAVRDSAIDDLSQYQVKTTLPYAGKWRIRAVHVADALHLTTYSAYEYLTVR